MWAELEMIPRHLFFSLLTDHTNPLFAFHSREQDIPKRQQDKVHVSNPVSKRVSKGGLGITRKPRKQLPELSAGKGAKVSQSRILEGLH
jgi:hypothetical protein